MNTIRTDFGSFHDPMAAFTSLGGDMETSFVAEDFGFDRRASMLSSGSSGPTMSFGSSPTDAASSSIPTTPIGDTHRQGGTLTPADAFMTPDSPCPPTWRSYGRPMSGYNVSNLPQQRYSNVCQDLTRNMLSADTSFSNPQIHSPHPMFGRDMIHTGLDPIQTQFSTGFPRNVSYTPYSHEDYSATSFSSVTSGESDSKEYLKPWHDEVSSKTVLTRARLDQPFNASKARRAKHRASKYNTETIAKGSHECTIPGCDNKRFQRKEHLRRHYQSKHSDTKFECLQGRCLGVRFCNKLLGIKPISRSDNVNQHSCTHVINGMGKTRNALCELLVAERCIRKDMHKQGEVDKANKQCEGLRQNMRKNAEDSASKGIKTAKPKPNVHISHDIMESLGFDCSGGCPMGELHVFEGDSGWGPLCMAFVGTSDSQNDDLAPLDGDLNPAAPSRPRKAKL